MLHDILSRTGPPLRVRPVGVVVAVAFARRDPGAETRTHHVEDEEIVGMVQDPTSTEDAAPVVVGYVGGMGRSGSTLLCRALSRLPGVVNVGELDYLWNQSVRNNRLCSCGQPFLSCPFWTRVGVRAFGGWSESPVDRADALRRRVERTRNLAALSGWATPDFRSAVTEYASLMDQVLVAIRDEADARVVVDNSKYPSCAFLRQAQDGVDMRLIHLVRDSRGVAFSWSKRVERPDFDGRRMRTFSPARSGLDWTVYNAAFEYLGKSGVPYLRLRYEDFVVEPARALRDLADHLGMKVADEDLGFVGDGSIDLAEDHSVWGNPARVTRGPQRLRVDDAWTTALPISDRRLVSALSWPGLRRYGYAMGGGR